MAKQAIPDQLDLLGQWQLMFYLAMAGFFFIGMLLFTGLVSGVFFIYGICVPLIFFPSIICLFLGMRGRKKAKKLEQVAGMIKAYRRISISELARKLNVSEFEAENMVGEMQKKGLLDGFIDRTTGEYVTKGAMGQELKAASCPKCGAPSDKIRLVGESLVCSFCNARIK